MHNLVNLNKFQDPYQVLEKNSKTHKKCFWPKILTTNTLGTNAYKMYKCDKNQMPYCNVKNFKKLNFWEFWAINRTWPTLLKFNSFYFHK